MRLAGFRNIVVLTGAGISRSAGLATYRGPGGLWSDPKLEELSHANAMVSQRQAACDMFWTFRRAIRKVEPTAAHRALAAFEASLPASTQFLIVTQNVDGLHQVAGNRNVCEYHGSLARWCCACGHTEEPPDSERVPVHCGDEPMRPDVVLFGEMIPVEAEHTVKRALRDCDLFVAIGTSGTVAPASSFVRWARMNHARTVLLNLEAIEGDDFTDVETGGADDLVPRWFAL